MSNSNLEIREYLVTRKKKNNKTSSKRCYDISWNIKERFFFNSFTYLVCILFQGSLAYEYYICINKYFIITKIIPYFTYKYIQLYRNK